MSDTEGKFVLEGLDPELLFRLLAYEKGFVPAFSEGFVDPRSGPVTLTLTPRDLSRIDPALVLRGRVVDAHGAPIARVVVSPFGRETEHGRQFGGLEEVDSLALTDEQGEFALAVSEPGESLIATLTARGFATRLAQWIEAGPEIHALPMTRGVTVTGVVQKDGKPLGAVEVGLVQEDTDAESFLGERSVGTNDEGRFTFVNVPPHDTWRLYGLMESFRKHGALASRPLKVGADETTLDVGVLALDRGSRLSGRVVLSDEKPLPPSLRVLLGREEAWDTQVALVAADGSFAFEGLPPELFTLNTRIAGYVLSRENASYDFLDQSGLLGRVDADVQGLVLLLEPGVRTYAMPRPEEGLMQRYEEMCKSALHGAPVEAVSPKAGK